MSPLLVSRSVKTTMNEIRDLRPARPEPEGEKPAYMPKVPWKWIASLGVFFVLSAGIYNVREREEEAALRTAIMRAHKQDLGPVVSRFEELVSKINGWTVAAAQAQKVEDFVDPRLNLDALHKGKGLYMRLKAKDAKSPDGIITGLEGAAPDAIARCLGLEPASVGELYARGSFLTSTWIERADEADSVMKLRVIADEIKQRSKRDLPFVATATGSDWFMLALEQGDNRRDAPVDMYLYDLRSNKLLLRSRVKAEGALVAARIAVEGVKPGAYASGAQTGAAQDCSIASGLRALAGSEATTFAATPPEPSKAYGGTEPAKAAVPVDAPKPKGAEPAVAPKGSAPTAPPTTP